MRGQLGCARRRTSSRSPSDIGSSMAARNTTDRSLIDDEVLADLERYVSLAPLHQPNNLAPIRSILARSPRLPQVACFDTAFHRGHNALADHYAIPERFYAEGVRRYGFHGLSYEYVASRLPQVAPEIATGRVIVAHLGSGASMCALVRRPQRREHDGFHRARRIADGHAPGPARSRRRALSDRGEADDRRRRFRTCSTASAAERPVRHQQRRARAGGELRPAGALRARLLRLSRRTACGPAGCGARRRSMPSCSRPESAKTLPACARASSKGSPGSAPCSIRTPMRPGSTSIAATRTAASRSLRRADRRGADDRAPYAGAAQGY